MSTSLARPALAEEPTVGHDVGVFLSYHFGGRGGGLGWGIEARRKYMPSNYDACWSDQAGFAAGVLRVMWQGFRQPSLIVGAQAGQIFGQVRSAHGELGLGYRWGAQSGLRLLVGAEIGVSLLATQGNWDLLQSEATMTGALRLPPTGNPLHGCAVDGRPLRDDAGEQLRESLYLAGVAKASDLPPAVHDAAVAMWCERARDEWASVPAFLQLADQLIALDAPEALVRASLRAAEQETHHAVMSAGVAAHLAGTSLLIDGQSLVQRAPLCGTEGLVRLAIESWIDGCVGEGTAAAMAREEKNHAGDTLLRSALAMVARDESAHAQLAWDTLDWALSVEPSIVAAALRATRQVGFVENSANKTQEPNHDLRAFGGLARGQRLAVAERVRIDAGNRLDARLAQAS